MTRDYDSENMFNRFRAEKAITLARSIAEAVKKFKLR
jgi:hypothetical protein